MQSVGLKVLADVNLDTVGLCRRNVRKTPASVTVVSPEILALESMTGMSGHIAGNKTAQCIQATLNMGKNKANVTCFEVVTRSLSAMCAGCVKTFLIAETAKSRAEKRAHT
ncbi:TPA: hypothetical protein ACTW52_000039 [Klebsiella quasipneumoniae subsp. similipneumoniae]|uniref:hypothetical protein n=1 Tax=Klebsiella quasipneumoniae TaxID=1463165 RepID=UPI002180DE5F|nr:hypothetical protein [Klebsiella quasipneumoniae]MEB5580677.1 hypothetical protein [Klebsiella quasipneumoniae]MEB5745393.1 hypothetical protein [Klebsiella quasipneumoniae]GKQ11086.1 hypothetical protein NUKP79_48070 [Klebsiella quasipneumoniae]HCI8788187.1 hypothetical protein [Klebsiella quasipneumoniae]